MMMGILRAVAIAALMFGHTIPALSQGWDWQNPLPRGYNIYDIEMIEDWYAVAVCEAGFIMRSNDGAATWKLERLGEATLTDLELANGHLWAVSEYGFIYHSSDYGVTWETQRARSSSEIGNSYIEMYDDQNGIAIIAYRIYLRTTNGGQTWETILSPHAGGNEIGRFIVSQTKDHWWALSNTALYKTTNFGETWFKQTNIENQGLVKMRFVNELTGYQCRDGNVLKTIDGGETWFEQDVFGFGYFLDIEAGPRLGNSAFALSEGIVLVNLSTDNGNTWNVSLRDDAFNNGTVNAISFFNDKIGLVAGGGGRILRTTDGGQSWSITHGIGFLGTIADMHFNDRNSGIAITRASAVLLTTDGGNRWSQSLAVENQTFEKLSMYSEYSGYAYAYDDNFDYDLFHTTDFGLTWEFVNDLPATEGQVRINYPRSIVTLHEDTIFIALAYGGFLRSYDGGETFDSLFVSINLRNQYNSGFEMAVFPPQTVLLASQNGTAYSTDFGDTWSFNSISGGRWLQYAQFLTPNLFFASANGYFAKSTNMGQNWGFGAEQDNEFVHFFDENNGVLYNTSYGTSRATSALLRTTDGGDTWTEESLNEQMGWLGWYWVDSQHGWAFGSNGMIRKTTQGGVVVVSANGPAVVAREVILQQNYPNPVSATTSGGTSITYMLPGAMQVRLAIYDALGREVAVLAEGTMPQGQHIANFTPPSHLQAGTYFYTLTTPAGVQTKKFVLVR